MSELFLSSNNLSIGDEELKCILTFLKISKDELIRMILDKTFTFYYNIEYYSVSRELYNLYFDIPPHITYELVILYQKCNKYYTMVFSKDKYPMEFSSLNQDQKYINMLPFGFTNYYEEVRYPIYKKCLKKNIYSIQHLHFIEIFFKIILPCDVISYILSYIVEESFDRNNSSFILTDKTNIGSNIYVSEYDHLYKKKIVLAIKV